MAILVLNAGGSSLKFRLFRASGNAELEELARGGVSELGTQAQWRWRAGDKHGEEVRAIPDHGAAAQAILDWLDDSLPRQSHASLTAVGHRVVHGGAEFIDPVRIDERVLERLEALNPLAPLHNPLALSVIRAARARLGPEVSMVAVFDTAFHHTLPERARLYALPDEWVRQHGLRRYGFHGLAHRYLAERCARLAHGRVPRRMITLQLGNGCSAAAIHNGRCIDTSMGFTPLEGLVMATRSGDIDPGILSRLLELGVSPQRLQRGLNREAGLLGLSGLSGDMRRLLSAEAEGHTGAHRAIEVFCYRARKQIGAYTAALGGLDALVFGGGVGEHAPDVRERICVGLEWYGIALDPAANRYAIGREARISMGDVGVFIVPVNEEALIAHDTLACLANRI